MIVRSRSHGRQRAYFYACSSYHHRGKTVCPNSLEMRLEAAEDAILSSLERELLDPEILQEAAARAAARVAAPAEHIETRRHTLEMALADTEAALARLTQGIAEGGSVPTLVQAIRDQQRRQQALRTELADIERPRVVPLNLAQLKARLKEKVGGMAGAPTEARADRASDVPEAGRGTYRVHAGPGSRTLPVHGVSTSDGVPNGGCAGVVARHSRRDPGRGRDRTRRLESAGGHDVARGQVDSAASGRTYFVHQIHASRGVRGNS